MGLRCLLGHDFGEPETERERNEEGNEVVVTVREVKTCERCGEKQVVSENKEITSIDQLRESATGVAAEDRSTTPSNPSEGGAVGEWGGDDTDTESDAESTPTADTEPEPAADDAEGVTADSDPVERGVADIIEQAEKDDDMLEQPPEAAGSGSADGDAEAADDGEDVPVHPGQRGGADEDAEEPAPESDDGVILDDDDAAPPEEGRRQWEEEASPEEVPGDDLNVGESVDTGDDDAEILDAGGSDSGSGGSPPEPSTPDVGEPAESTAPAAVESEDAEIMDAGPEVGGGDADPEPEASGPAAPEPEPDSGTEREETEEGHMPWPEAPTEDEQADREPVDIDFGEDGTPKTDATAGGDQANGHRSEDAEPGDASTGPSANVDLERSSRDAGREYYCPECGLTREVGNSSMRAGDICPECRVGYITEQQRAE